MRRYAFLVSLSAAVIGCDDGACPDGFVADNAGNCLQAGDTGGGGEPGPGRGDDDDDDDDDDDNSGDDDDDNGDDDDDDQPQGEEDDATLVIENWSDWEINELYVSPCSSDSWGDDVFSDPLPSGYEVDVTGFPPGCYDLLAVSYEIDGYWEEYDADIDGTYVWSLYN